MIQINKDIQTYASNHRWSDRYIPELLTNSVSTCFFTYRQGGFFNVLTIPIVHSIRNQLSIFPWSSADESFNRSVSKSQLYSSIVKSGFLILAEHDYPPVLKDEVFKEIFEQAENFKKYLISE